MKKLITIFALAMALVALNAQAFIISDVPAYNWTIGCSPTAAGSVLGYWDGHGFDGLFSATSSAVYQTANVGMEIGQIATLMNTLGNGKTYVKDFDTAIESFTESKGYSGFDSQTKYFIDTNWLEYVTNIDARRPALVTIDTGGDRLVDHTVTGIGYELRGNARWYGFYDGWGESETIKWKPFETIDSGYAWSIGWLTYLLPGDMVEAAETPREIVIGPSDSPTTPVNVPEPASGILLATGILALIIGGAIEGRMKL